MKKRQKNNFFACIFALIPGAVEMYFGFMLMGLSLMTIFMCSLFIPLIIYSASIFGFVPMIIWFYGFFHARNITTADPEEFSRIEDHFIWEELESEHTRFPKLRSESLRKWAAYIVIILGMTILWGTFGSMVLRFVPERYWNLTFMMVERLPRIAFAILLIYVGFRLIRGKKEALEENAHVDSGAGIEEENDFEGAASDKSEESD